VGMEIHFPRLKELNKYSHKSDKPTSAKIKYLKKYYQISCLTEKSLLTLGRC
jgi:hypothetical protein